MLSVESKYRKAAERYGLSISVLLELNTLAVETATSVYTGLGAGGSRDRDTL